jgi:hypothetical protein
VSIYKEYEVFSMNILNFSNKSIFERELSEKSLD